MRSRAILDATFMPGLVASLLGALWGAPDAVVAALLLALPAFGLRCLLRALLDRGASPATSRCRLGAGVCALIAAAALAPVGWVFLAHTRESVIAAGLAFTLVLVSAALPSVRVRSRVAARLLPILLVLLLAGLLALTLLRAGYLHAATGETLVVVEVTGESRREIVRFTPPGLPLREEGLRAERLLLSQADGVPVGETWIFGRAATLGGEILRLRTWGGGGACLARFDTAANDASTQDGRAALYPPQKAVVHPLARGALPAWWRGRQRAWLVALGLEPGALVSPPVPLLDAHGLIPSPGFPHHLTCRGKPGVKAGRVPTKEATLSGLSGL